MDDTIKQCKASRRGKNSSYTDRLKACTNRASRRELKADEKCRRYEKSWKAPQQAGSITNYVISQNFVWGKDDDLECDLEALRAKGKRKRKRSSRGRKRGPINK